jgi:chromosome segregation ATPase
MPQCEDDTTLTDVENDSEMPATPPMLPSLDTDSPQYAPDVEMQLKSEPTSPGVDMRTELIDSYIKEEQELQRIKIKFEQAKKEKSVSNTKVSKLQQRREQLRIQIERLNKRIDAEIEAGKGHKNAMDEAQSNMQASIERTRDIKGRMTGEEGFELAMRLMRKDRQ